MIERAIYSLWTKPMDAELRFNSEQSLMECFALSVNCAKKWFKEVHLITDYKGKELVDDYNLTFDEINTDLEHVLKNVNKKNWAIGKIYACKIQDKPFIHIDSDVFLFKPLPETFLSKDAGFQNLEPHTYHAFYGNMISCDKNNYKTPAKWYNFPDDKNGKSFNCGIIFFNRLDILDEWWEEALKYANYYDKLGGFGDVVWDLPSLIFEQHFIASICKSHELNIGFLTDYHTIPEIDINFIDEKLAKELGYTHLICDCKKNVVVEEKVREKLKEEGIVIKKMINEYL